MSVSYQSAHWQEMELINLIAPSDTGLNDTRSTVVVGHGGVVMAPQ